MYTEDSAEYQIVLDRLTRKFHTAKRLVPAAAIEYDAKIDIAVVAYGSSDGAVREALDVLAAHGLKANYMRLRAFPFGEDVEKFLEAHKLVFVVEQNRDGQMRSLLTLETRVEKPSCARCCITAACRSPRSSSSRVCSPRSNPRPANPKWCRRRP